MLPLDSVGWGQQQGKSIRHKPPWTNSSLISEDFWYSLSERYSELVRKIPTSSLVLKTSSGTVLDERSQIKALSVAKRNLVHMLCKHCYVSKSRHPLSGPLRLRDQSRPRTRLRIATSITFCCAFVLKGLERIVAPLPRGRAPYAV